jgi:quinol monooxygenase YgiN
MSEPVVFISHFRIRDGAFDALKRLSLDTTQRLREEKPGTVLFLSYVDEDRGVISFLHAFPDADALDIHRGFRRESARSARVHRADRVGVLRTTER